MRFNSFVLFSCKTFLPVISFSWGVYDESLQGRVCCLYENQTDFYKEGLWEYKSVVSLPVSFIAFCLSDGLSVCLSVWLSACLSIECEFVFRLIPVDRVQHFTHLQFIRTNLGVWIALDNDFGKLSKLEWRNIVVQSFNGPIQQMAVPPRLFQRSNSSRWNHFSPYFHQTFPNVPSLDSHTHTYTQLQTF